MSLFLEAAQQGDLPPIAPPGHLAEALMVGAVVKFYSLKWERSPSLKHGVSFARPTFYPWSFIIF